jgi:hypothetical protein
MSNGFLMKVYNNVAKVNPIKKPVRILDKLFPLHILNLCKLQSMSAGIGNRYKIIIL